MFMSYKVETGKMIVWTFYSQYNLDALVNKTIYKFNHTKYACIIFHKVNCKVKKMY